VEMAEVDGIEGSAEEADAFGLIHGSSLRVRGRRRGGGRRLRGIGG
jgi:hypothetical protein